MKEVVAEVRRVHIPFLLLALATLAPLELPADTLGGGEEDKGRQDLSLRDRGGSAGGS
jgi:hypothetical protein